jgi:hypothetical protein
MRPLNTLGSFIDISSKSSPISFTGILLGITVTSFYNYLAHKFDCQT